MKQAILKPFLFISVMALTLYSPLVVANPKTNNANAGYKVHLQDADIKAFVDQIASITNKNVILDPRVSGNVTVITNQSLSKAEIYELFLAVLKVNGIVAIDNGLSVELLPDGVAKQANIDVDLRGTSKGAMMSTRIFYLTNTNANDMLTVIRPLMPPYANAVAVANVNALILSDRADGLNQMAKLIKDLDNDINDSLTIIPLKHVDSHRMMELLNSLTGVGGTNANKAPTGGIINIVADPSADRLLIKGNPEMTAKIKAMVAQLDTEPSKRLGGLRVFRLKYASATHIADMLRGLLANQSLNTAGEQSTLQATSMFNANNHSQNTTTSHNTAATGSPINTSSNANSTNQQNRPFSIIADKTQNAIIVNASPELMAEIEMAIEKLDIRREQVLIQAAIIEISGNDSQQLGVQWALGSANSGVGVVNFNNTGTSVVGLASEIATKLPGTAAAAIAGALLGVGDSRTDSQGNRQFYGAILQAINKTNSANLLSMPSIVTLDNEKANILVGQNVPFVTGSYTTTGNSSTNPFQTVDRQDVGINLNVIPHIGENGAIRLEISQEVSSIIDTSLKNVNGLMTNKNLIKTTIMANDRQTVALGGLMRDNSSYGQQKVPVLGDIPVVGNLFRSKNKSSDKTNLIVFLQPTILREGGAIASLTENNNGKIRTMQLSIDSNGTLKKVPLTNQITPQINSTNSFNQSTSLLQLPKDDLVKPVSQGINQIPVKQMPQNAPKSDKKPTSTPNPKPKSNQNTVQPSSKHTNQKVKPERPIFTIW